MGLGKRGDGIQEDNRNQSEFRNSLSLVLHAARSTRTQRRSGCCHPQRSTGGSTFACYHSKCWLSTAGGRQTKGSVARMQQNFGDRPALSSELYLPCGSLRTAGALY